MGSGPDPTSFTARRSAASNLPNFHLPPPELPNMQKFPPFAALNATQPMPLSTGNLLTPPSNVSGDSLSPGSGLNSGSSGASHSGIPPYNPLGFWPSSQSGSPYGMGSGLGPSPFLANQAPGFPGRSMFSPSLSSLGRNNTLSPGGGDLPPPPYELSLPPFQAPIPISAPGSAMSSSLPNLAVQQQAQQQAIASAFLNTQTPVSAQSQPSNPSHALDPPPHQRPQAGASYYGGAHPASAPAHQTSFPNLFTAPSPTQQSPGSASRISPMSATAASHAQSLHAGPGASSQHYSRPVSYPLPAVSGPIMSNLHSPGGHMSLVGGMAGGMVPGYGSHGNMPHMYGGHPHAQQQQQNDRPFKCDQCPQSFNRNHDLKRHKRIHLAVKPFPCGHCDKSFSRKDALKRHILVKGCGKSHRTGSGDIKTDGSLSPPDKSEALSSDEADESPSLDGGPTLKGNL
ncbi:MAG: hypothetical protein M1817_003757 [Caeruleum heppii]|nr:MAG: hypothetical protein M1817_003757 [Caeruleum heppii]